MTRATAWRPLPRSPRGPARGPAGCQPDGVASVVVLVACLRPVPVSVLRVSRRALARAGAGAAAERRPRALAAARAARLAGRLEDVQKVLTTWPVVSRVLVASVGQAR